MFSSVLRGRRTLAVLAAFVFLALAPGHATAQRRPNTELDAILRTYGSPIPLGVITSDGTSKNNHSTAVAFNNTSNALKGKVLLVYAVVAGVMLPGDANSASTTATTGQATTGVPLVAGQLAIITMHETLGWLAWKATVSGDLQVWELR